MKCKLDIKKGIIKEALREGSSENIKSVTEDTLRVSKENFKADNQSFRVAENISKRIDKLFDTQITQIIPVTSGHDIKITPTEKLIDEYYNKYIEQYNKQQQLESGINKEGDSEPLYQIKPTTTHSPNEELNTRLKEFANVNGIPVEVFDTLIERLGGDYVAAYDTFNKAILIAHNKSDITTLPEEVAHMIIDLLGKEHPLIKSLLVQVQKMDYKDYLRKEDPSYEDLYNGDNEIMILEVAGKLLRDKIINRHLSNEKTKTILEKLIDKILKFFKKMSLNSLDKVKESIDEITSQLADKAFNKEVIRKDYYPTIQNQPANRYLFQTSIKKEDSPIEYKAQLIVLKRRIKKFETARKKYAPTDAGYVYWDKKIIDLQAKIESYEESKNKEVLIKAGLELLNGIESFIDKVSTDIEQGKNIADIDPQDIAYSIEILDTFSKMEGTIETATRLKNLWEPIISKIALAYVNKFNTSGKEITEEDIKSQIHDIGDWITKLGTATDATDYLVRTAGSLIKSTQAEISRNTKHIKGEIEEAVKNLQEYQQSSGISLKDMYDIFIQDIDTTTVLTRPYTTEYYNLYKASWKDGEKGAKWRAENTYFDQDSSEWKPSKREFINSNYERIQSTPELKKFYDFYKKTINEAKSKLPINVAEDFIANIQESVFKNIITSDKTIGQKVFGLTEHIFGVKTISDSDFIFDEELLTDELSPNKFQKRLTAKEKTRNLGDALYEFATFAESYDKISQVLPVVKLLKDQIANKKYISASRQKISIEGAKSNAHAMITAAMDMQLLGKMKKEDEFSHKWKTLDENGNEITKSVSASYIGDLLLRMNSILRIGLSPAGALSNIFIGDIGNIVEAFGGRFFGVSDLNKASGIFFQEIFKEDSKLRAVLEQLNPLMELEDYKKPDIIAGKKLSPEKFMELLYSLQSKGELFLQSRTMIANMLHDEVMTKDGKKITVWEAFDDKGNVRKDVDLKGLSEQEFMDKISLKVKAINKSIHGRYSSQDASSMQQFVLFRMASQFRKWIPAALENRFGIKKYSNDLGVEIEGRYRNTLKMLIELAKYGGKLKEGRELTELEKYSLKKNLADVIIFAATMFLYAAVKGGDDDKNEKRLRNPWIKLSLDQLNRASGDMLFFLNPKEFNNMGKNALPVTKLIDDVLTTITYIPYAFSNDPKARYRSGSRKGENKFWAKAADITPGLNNIHKIKRAWNDYVYMEY